MGFRDKLIRFMYGRYGVDQFSKFLLGLGIFLCLIDIFIFNFYVSTVLNICFWFILIYSYFRIFSRNIYKRSAENEKYLRATSGIRSKINSFKRDWSQRKVYRFYRCPGCNQKIRIPKGHGRVEIRCPKCNTKFIKNS